MNKKLDSYIEGIKELPGTPAVLVRMIALFQQSDHEVKDVVELMSQDPSLTAEVLRHANSAYCCNEEPIVDVFEGITKLGFYEVYQIVVSKLGSQALRRPRNACGMDVEKLWRHSVMAAVGAGLIAREVQENEGLAFTAGLLHDIGKTVLALAEGSKYTALTQKIGDGGSQLEGVEALLFGFGHAQVGARLLSQWGLPEEISVPVLHHHQVRWVEPFERICAVVSLGNIMAHSAEANIPGKLSDSEEAASAMAVLQLREDDMATLLQEAQDDIKRMTGLLAAGAK
jgi:putative nucleotidyltransferase with HDIG domain